MERKAHSDACHEEIKGCGTSIGADVEVTLKDERNITALMFEIEDIRAHFRETHSPIHAQHKADDKDISPSSPLRHSQQWHYTATEESEMSPTIRRRQASTLEAEDPGYAIDFFNIGSLAQQSDRTTKPGAVLDSPSNQRDIEETVLPANNSLLSSAYNQLFYWTSYWPVFTFSIMFINWVFFIWGIVWIIGWENANVSLTTPVSPPQSIFPFITVNYWPSCTSARGNTWRLVSAQFTHAGIQHIGGNTLAALIYGSTLECSHPYHWIITILAYEMGCIFGCLGHSYVWPFEGIIGCSTGIYGLIGCCISHLILDQDTLHPHLFKALGVALALQGTYDMVTYFLMYNPDVAYAGHCTGFFTGLLIGLSFGLLNKQNWKKVMGVLGIMGLLVLTISLLVHYLHTWPPHMLNYNPTFHSYSRRSCCGDLYGVTNSTFSLDQARQTYGCDGEKIFDWHKI